MKKTLNICIILCVVLCVIAIVFFFLMKNAEPNNSGEDTENYNVGHIVEKIDFLKLNTYDEIKKYADEYPIYIQTSDDKNLFAIGELYIEENPVQLFYQLNDDNTINRFDGKYSYKLDKSSAKEVQYIVDSFNSVVSKFFEVDEFAHDLYDEKGAPTNTLDEESYTSMLNGKAKYGLSVVDKDSTYWYITINVTDKKYLNFEFFRCFDSSVYNDDSPNIDLRVAMGTGE